MSYNVPAVCEGFSVAIKEREAFQQPQNFGVARAAERRRSAYSPVMRSAILIRYVQRYTQKSGGKNRRFTGAEKRRRFLSRPPLGV
jgi:hypothetical protein